MKISNPYAARAELCRRHLKEFIKEFWPVIEPSTPFIDGWHIDCFVDHLEHIHEIGDLLISCPPGISKSSIFCILWFAHRWVNDPAKKFIYGSHSLSVAHRDGLRCRKLIQSEKFQQLYPNEVTIDPAQSQKHHFNNTATGWRLCSSMDGGAITGHKGNYVVVDDPLNASDCESDLIRKAAQRNFADNWINRVCDFKNDCRIVIGNRLHKDDLHAFIMENYNWCHINLPWEYKPTQYVTSIGWRDPRTKPGEPLCPQRYPERKVKEFKRRPASFAAQWNQCPTDAEHTVFVADNFRYYTEKDGAYFLPNKRQVAKEECYTVLSCDPAISERSRDYTAIAVADVSAWGDVILRNVIHEKLSAAKVVNKLQTVDAKYKPSYILIESGGISTAVLQQAKLVSTWHGVIRGVKTKKGVNDNADIKQIRAIDLQLLFEEHRIFFPVQEPWLAAVEQELQDFPNGTNDDIVDSLSYLVSFVRKRTRGRPEEPEPKKVNVTLQEIDRIMWQRIWGD